MAREGAMVEDAFDVRLRTGWCEVTGAEGWWSFDGLQGMVVVVSVVRADDS